MKIAIIIIAILFSTSATAGERHPSKGKPHDKPSHTHAGNSNSNNSSGGAGGNASASGGSATSGATATAGSTSVSGASAAIGATSFSFAAPAIPEYQQIDTRISGTTTVRQAPDMALLTGSPTSACMNVIGLGGSGSAGGGLLSFSVGVEWCKSFEMARQARNHGLNTLAEDLMCNVEEVKALNSRDCFGARKRAEDAAREKAATEPQQVARTVF